MKVAIPTANQKTICEYIPFCKYLMIIDTETNETELIENPIFKFVKEKQIKKRECGENGLQTGQILPPLLKEKGVNLLIAMHLGEGLLDNLEIYGIKYEITNEREIKKLKLI
jgi:predicted Fe-Mo cluster-binding NifX family protein